MSVLDVLSFGTYFKIFVVLVLSKQDDELLNLADVHVGEGEVGNVPRSLQSFAQNDPGKLDHGIVNLGLTTHLSTATCQVKREVKADKYVRLSAEARLHVNVSMDK